MRRRRRSIANCLFVARSICFVSRSEPREPSLFSNRRRCAQAISAVVVTSCPERPARRDEATSAEFESEAANYPTAPEMDRDRLSHFLVFDGLMHN